MALDRVACRREGAHQVLVLDAARGDRLRAPGRTRQAQVAHRARLPGAQAGTRAWALRGPRLARLPPPCQLVPCSLWLPDHRTGENSPSGSAAPKLKAIGLPTGDRPRGASDPTGAARPDLNRHHAPEAHRGPGPKPRAMSVLRNPLPQASAPYPLVTQ